MIKLMIGVKGVGKTKTLIDRANSALAATNGSVVVLEKGDKLLHDINYQARLINTNDYLIEDASSLAGFIAGVLASNSDMTDVLVDSALKIAGNDVAAFEASLAKLEKLTAVQKVNIFMTVSMPIEEASDTLKKYI